MARKQSTRQLIASLFPIACLLSFVGILAAGGTWISGLITAVLIYILAFILNGILRNQENERLRKSGIDDIDKMDGIQFEHYLKLLFQQMGYTAEVTRAAGDYGADLILSKNGSKIVVQAKRHSKNIGVAAIQEANTSMPYYDANEAWVITNRYFTEPAESLAKKANVRLINRDRLIDMILKVNPAQVTKPKQIMANIPTEEILCDRCGKPMIRRKGPKGEFFGCSNFPKCRNIKPV